MASYVESATLKVIDEASAPIAKIDASLQKLMKTAAAFAKATDKFSKSKPFEPLFKQVRQLRTEFEALERVSRRVARGVSTGSGSGGSGGLGGVATSAKRAQREVRQLGTELQKIGTRSANDIARSTRAATAAQVKAARDGATAITAAHGQAARDGAAAIQEAYRRVTASIGGNPYDVGAIAQQLTQAHVQAAQAGVQTYMRGLRSAASQLALPPPPALKRLAPPPGMSTRDYVLGRRARSGGPLTTVDDDTPALPPPPPGVSPDAMRRAYRDRHGTGGVGFATAYATQKAIASASNETSRRLEEVARNLGAIGEAQKTAIAGPTAPKAIAGPAGTAAADTDRPTPHRIAELEAQLARREKDVRNARARLRTAQQNNDASSVTANEQAIEQGRRRLESIKQDIKDARDRAAGRRVPPIIDSAHGHGNGGGTAPPPPPRGPSVPSVPPAGGGGGGGGRWIGPGGMIRRGTAWAGAYAAASAIGTTARTAGQGIAEGSSQRTLNDMILTPEVRKSVEQQAEAASIKYRMLTKAGLSEIGRDAIGNLNPENAGDAGAVMEHMAKAAQAMAMSYGSAEKGTEAARQFYRAADIMGMARTGKDVGTVLEAMTTQQLKSGKDINARSVAQAVANLGTAKYGMGADMLGDLISLSDEVRGQTAAYIRSFTQDVTRSNLHADNKAAMEKAGLREKDGGAVDAGLLQKDEFEWVMQHIKPLVEKMGVDLNDTDPGRKAAAINAALNKLGFLPGSAKYASYALEKEQSIRQDRAARKRVKYGDDYVKGLADRDVRSAMTSVESAWKDSWDQMTKPFQKTFAGWLGGISTWLKTGSTEANAGRTRLAVGAGTVAAGVGALIWNNRVEAAQLGAAAALTGAAGALTGAAGKLAVSSGIPGVAGAVGGSTVGRIIRAVGKITIVGAAGIAIYDGLPTTEEAKRYRRESEGAIAEADRTRKEALKDEKAAREGRPFLHYRSGVRPPLRDYGEAAGPPDPRRRVIVRSVDHDKEDLGHGMYGPPDPSLDGKSWLRRLFESIIGPAKADDGRPPPGWTGPMTMPGSADAAGPAPAAAAAAAEDVQSAGADIRAAFESVGAQVQGAGEILSAAFAATGEAVQAAGSALGGAIEGAGGAVVGALEGIAAQIGSISIPNPGRADVGTNAGSVR